MVKEKILLVGDSLQGPTGFANDLAGVSWSLAEKFDVHVLGLQSQADHKVKLDIEGIPRTVIQHANLPRGKGRWDFGTRSLPRLLDALEPEILLTVNDIQMVQHVPQVMCPNAVNIPVIDLPSKKFISEEAVKEKLIGEMLKFQENFPRETKWIQYAPQDGDPPMQQWDMIYKMADKVVAMSDYGKGIFKQYYGMDTPRIWHGVDSKVFTNQDKPKNLQDKFVIGNFNRNQPRKQPVRNIMAFAKFAKDKKDVFLHMQMDWNDEFGWPIQYFAQIYGVLNRMVQPKQVGMPREEVAKTYNMWDLNVNTAAGEGFGLVGIEGFSCGVPYICTDYTTTKELIIDGTPSPRGTPVKVAEMHWQKMDVAAVRRALIDINDLADTFNKYYYNRSLIEEHGKNAEEWCHKNTSWKVIAPQWQSLVSKVLAGD